MEKFYIINDASEIEYEILVDKGINKCSYKLIYGKVYLVHLIGKVALEIIDTGNDISFSKISKKMDYCDFSELRILSSFISKYNNNLDSDYQYIQTNQLINL